MKYLEWPLSAPVNVTWEITHKCNLECIHCLSGSSSEASGELDFNECRGIVDQLAALKVFEINFGGGEPLLKTFFLPLLRYIHDKGISSCVSTNGTLLTHEILTCFDANPLLNVQVSLDGATAKVNDRIRGKGTFQQIIKGIELLAGKNIPLSINTVVTSLNFAQLDQLKELSLSFGAKLRVSRFRPAGRARDLWDVLKLSSTQLRKLSEWLKNDPTVLTGDSFFSISQDGGRDLGLDMCGACKMTCCIDPIGSVYPCAFMQEAEFYGGSLRETSLRNIWDSAPVFRYFRNTEPQACRKCAQFERCRGGCPAVAYFVNRDLNSADPECLVNWSREISSTAPLTG